MERVVLAVAIVAVVSLIALVVRRRTTDAPTQSGRFVPEQLDRHDFGSPTTPWLLVAFTSATCHTCSDMVAKALVLSSPAVGVVEVEFGAERDLHRRYAIDAVPTLVLADRHGVVHRSFIGSVTATDLWAAVAEARGPEEA